MAQQTILCCAPPRGGCGFVKRADEVDNKYNDFLTCPSCGGKVWQIMFSQEESPEKLSEKELERKAEKKFESQVME